MGQAAFCASDCRRKEFNMNKRLHALITLVLIVVICVLASKRMPADTSTCGGVSTTLPFTDVAGNLFFCQIAEAFFSGLSNGTSPTTYSPSADVPREQMAAFITRTQDAALRRGSRRAALRQWSLPTVVPQNSTGVGLARLIESDGADLWVADFGGGS